MCVYTHKLEAHIFYGSTLPGGAHGGDMEACAPPGDMEAHSSVAPGPLFYGTRRTLLRHEADA